MVDANLNKQSEVLLKTVNAVEIPPKSESIIPVSVPPFYKSQLSVVEATSITVWQFVFFAQIDHGN